MRRFSLVVATTLLLFASPAMALFGESKRPDVGDDAPRFTVPLLGGGEFDIGPHIGKNVILLDFWSIYCVACIKEMPHLVDIYDKYKDQDLVAVAVNLDSFGTRRVARFVKGLKFKVTYPIVIDKRRAVAGKYGVSVLPTTIVIGKDGKVRYYHVGYTPGDEAEIEEEIVKALEAP